MEVGAAVESIRKLGLRSQPYWHGRAFSPAQYMDPAAIDLDLHIKDVTELLESEGLDRVILVGQASATQEWSLPA